MADERAIVGTKNQFIEACNRLARDPLALTTFDFKMFESTHPELAIEGRRKQAKARATAAEAAVVAQQKAMNEQAASLATTTRVRLTPYKEGDDFDAWLEKNAEVPAPIWMIQGLREFAKQINEKNKERNKRLDTLESQMQGLAARAGRDTGQDSTIEARLKALESKPTITYEGVWAAARVYAIGAMVTHQGSVWHAKSPNVSRRPGTDPNAWTLAVKSGRDGKDLR